MDHAALRPGARVGDGEDRLAAQASSSRAGIGRRRALDEGEVAAAGAGGRGQAAHGDAMAVDLLGGGGGSSMRPNGSRPITQSWKGAPGPSATRGGQPT